MGDSIPDFDVSGNIMSPRCQTKSQKQELIDNRRRPKEDCPGKRGNRKRRDAGKGLAVLSLLENF
jgi:hypothetical protein